MAKIAIIGTGIAGMASSYFLNKAGHDITVFEKNDYIGGHTHTVFEADDGKQVPIDTGFIVFNNINYPNLVKIFNEIKVETKNTDMSFSVSNPEINLEYCGSTLNTLFCQRKNLLRPSFYKLLLEINRFNKMAPEVLENEFFKDYTIEEYFKYRNIGDLCLKQYLLPMSVALWSAPQEIINNFPMRSLVRFFKNHGLLGFTTQLQWKTVTNGSWSYRDLLINDFKDKIHLSSNVESVTRSESGVKVIVNGQEQHFDKVILASHADQSYNILKDKTPMEEDLLSKFRYQSNRVDLHTDKRVMPTRKLGWAAWNHVVTSGGTYVSYWMNKLQILDTPTDFFVTLNAESFLDQSKIKQTFYYHHPIFDVPAMNAQEKLPQLNSKEGSVYFCGSYFRNGFHEDAAMSAVNMCKTLLGDETIL